MLSWIHYPESQPFHHLLMLVKKKDTFCFPLDWETLISSKPVKSRILFEPINRETSSTQDSEAYLNLQRGIQRKIGFGQTARGVTSTEHPKCSQQPWWVFTDVFFVGNLLKKKTRRS